MTAPEPVLLVAEGVVTGDPRPGPGPAARAVLVDGERIAWVGADPADAPRSDGRATRTVELTGAWLAPAFVDAHVHGTLTGLGADGVALAGVASLSEVLDRLRAAAATAPVGEALLGDGWDDSVWPERRPPTADEIAAAAPGRTVLLGRVDAHSCVVDRATLAALALDDVDGVDRDAGGAPTGWLREDAAAVARRHVHARLSPTRLRTAREAFAHRAAALGIASVHEMGHPGLSGLDDALAWAAGEWPVEVLVWWADLDPQAALAHGLRPGGDLFVDGSVGSRTAAVTTPYPDGSTGDLFVGSTDLAGFFGAAWRAGTGAAVHAIGDRAVHEAVVGIGIGSVSLGRPGPPPVRHRVEHVEMLDMDHARLMADLGAIASVQPAFDATWGGDGGLYAQRFGADVARRMNPFARLLAAGVTLAFGSDTPVTPLDPWGGVVAAQRHRGGLGIPRRAAFTAATRGGREAAAQDDVGHLRPGWRADLAAWDLDPFAVGDPRRATCVATVVAGRLAHGDVPGLAPR